MTTDKAASVILDIESLVHSQDKCSSPKLTVSFVSCYMIYCNKIFTISFSELKLPLLFSMGLFFNFIFLQKALSRKGSCRNDRKSTEENETEDASKKLAVKGT